MAHSWEISTWSRSPARRPKVTPIPAQEWSDRITDLRKWSDFSKDPPKKRAPKKYVSLKSDADRAKLLAETLALAKRNLTNENRQRLCIARYEPLEGVLPKIMIFGESPGREEMKNEAPFTGRSGKMLDVLLEKNDLVEDVFLTNLQFWTPKNNASKEEITEGREECKPYLRALIAILQPKIVLALGAEAARDLSGSKLSLERMRTHYRELDSSWEEPPEDILKIVGDVPSNPLGSVLTTTWHTAYLLRTAPQSAAESLWQDFREIRQRLSTFKT